MKIKRCDMYKFTQYYWKFFSIYFVPEDRIPWNVTYFLKDINSLEGANWCKNYLTKDENAFGKVGIIQDVEVTIDRKNHLVYFSEATEGDYRFQDKNITTEKVLQMCYNGELQYDVMTYDNFLGLIDAWIVVLKQDPAFVLLYQDEHDWYHLKSFATEDAMRDFVAEHAK